MIPKDHQQLEATDRCSSISGDRPINRASSSWTQTPKPSNAIWRVSVQVLSNHVMNIYCKLRRHRSELDFFLETPSKQDYFSALLWRRFRFALIIWSGACCLQKFVKASIKNPENFRNKSLVSTTITVFEICLIEALQNMLVCKDFKGNCRTLSLCYEIREKMFIMLLRIVAAVVIISTKNCSKWQPQNSF